MLKRIRVKKAPILTTKFVSFSYLESKHAKIWIFSFEKSLFFAQKTFWMYMLVMGDKFITLEKDGLWLARRRKENLN
jgi:hypothetical protein